MIKTPSTEIHPLKPFLPMGAKILLLGSFPPQKTKWCMDFYYPNFQNDMWRIMGLIFFANKEHFMTTAKKSFDKERIVQFLADRKIAVADMGYEVIRKRGNASDNFLEIVTPLDLQTALSSIPECKTLVTTGKKSSDTLKLIIPDFKQQVGIGTSANITFNKREFVVYRMPSSSRAYPKALHEKATLYEKMFRERAVL